MTKSIDLTRSERNLMPSRVGDLGSPFEHGRFLTITGALNTEGGLAVEPGFLVNFRRRVLYPELNEETLKEVVVVEFLDERRELLTQCPIPLISVCTIRAVDSGSRIFAASVPAPGEYHFIRYHARDRLLKEQRRPDSSPLVKFIQTPDAKAKDDESVRWEVSRRGEADIRSIVLFSNDDGRSWKPIVPPSPNVSNSVSVRFAGLPGGTARLKALATDGFSTTETESAPFEVPAKGVRPSILGPAEGTEVSSELPTWFHGQAYDYEKQDRASGVDLIWRSSRDGELGRGPVIAAKLTAGVHEIALACCGRAVNVSLVAAPNRRFSRADPGRDPAANADRKNAGCGCSGTFGSSVSPESTD